MFRLVRNLLKTKLNMSYKLIEYVNDQEVLISSDVHNIIIYQGFHIGNYNDIISIQKGYFGIFIGQSASQYLGDYVMVTPSTISTGQIPFRREYSKIKLLHSSGNFLIFNHIKLVRSFKYEFGSHVGMIYLFEYNYTFSSKYWIDFSCWWPPYTNVVDTENGEPYLYHYASLGTYFQIETNESNNPCGRPYVSYDIDRQLHYLAADNDNNGTFGFQFTMPFLHHSFLQYIHEHGTVPYLNDAKRGMDVLTFHRLARSFDWSYFNQIPLQGHNHGYVLVGDGLFHNISVGLNLFKLMPGCSCVTSHRGFLSFMQAQINKTFYRGCRSDVTVYDEVEDEWWSGYAFNGGTVNYGPSIGSSHYTDCSPNADANAASHYPIELVVVDSIDTYQPVSEIFSPYLMP